MKIVTNSMYIALGEKAPSDCKRNKEKQERDFLHSKDCNDSFSAEVCSNLFPFTGCAKHKKHDKKESLDCSRKNLAASKSCVCVATRMHAQDYQQIIAQFELFTHSICLLIEKIRSTWWISSYKLYHYTRGYFPLEKFSHTVCQRNRGTCSIWKTSSNKMSLVEKMKRLINFFCCHVSSVKVEELIDSSFFGFV